LIVEKCHHWWHNLGRFRRKRFGFSSPFYNGENTWVKNSVRQ